MSPRGSRWWNPCLIPPLRHEVYVTGCYTLSNENLAIVKLQPQVHKDDFASVESALRYFFQDVH